jgi:mannan endo-1,4-beta-mannosidase
MRSRHLFLVMTLFVVGAFGYAVTGPHRGESTHPAASGANGPPETVTPTVAPPYDVSRLLAPDRDYLGVALSGVPQDMSRAHRWAAQVGAKPNIITIYESFEDDFAAAEVRKIYEYGALPIVRWEPYTVALADIAAGTQDAYVTAFATAVRALNVPIALTFAHEMNGHWYPWGTRGTEAADFVAAWRHLHRLFATAGASNVIWTWTPNVSNPISGVKLAPLYPGDAYVDWVGIDGYFTHRGEQTFADLFGPTMKQVRGFTKRPFLIVETGSEPGSMRARVVADLFASVAKASDIIGFVYFNQKGSGDWSIDSDRPAIATYRSKVKSLPFGFTVS